MLPGTVWATRPLWDIASGLFAQLATDDVFSGLLALDGLALLVIAVCLGVAVLSIFSALGSPGAVEYSLLVIVFLSSAALTVSSANILLFYAFWELTSLCGWGISRWSTYSDDYATGAFPIQGAGALASLSMFLALLLLAVENRSLSIAGLHTENLTIVSLLILAAVLLKAYGLVSQSWRHDRDKIYSVSSGLVASAGVVVLSAYPYLRLLQGNFALQAEWREQTLWFAFPLALLVGLAALAEDELHRIVSGAVYSQFCILVAAISLSTPQGLTGALLCLLAYCLSVNGLFLCIGVLESRSGEQTLSALGGMASRLPATAALFVLSAIAFSGLPPFGGFIGRLVVGMEYLRTGQTIAFIALMAVSGLSLMITLRLFGKAFLGTTSALVREGHPSVLLATLGVLGVLCYLGFQPTDGAGWVQPAVQSMLR